MGEVRDLSTVPSMSDPIFGMYNPNTQEMETPLERIENMYNYFNSLTGFWKLSGYNRRLIMLERYLSMYLGFKLKPNDPIGRLFEYTPKEDYFTNGRRRHRINQYTANEIRDAFGYTLDEFLALPTYQMEHLLDRQRVLLKQRRDDIERQRKIAEQIQNNPRLSENFHSFTP